MTHIFYVLKCWMFSLRGWRLILELESPSQRPYRILVIFGYLNLDLDPVPVPVHQKIWIRIQASEVYFALEDFTSTKFKNSIVGLNLAGLCSKCRNSLKFLPKIQFFPLYVFKPFSLSYSFSVAILFSVCRSFNLPPFFLPQTLLFCLLCLSHSRETEDVTSAFISPNVCHVAHPQSTAMTSHLLHVQYQPLFPQCQHICPFLRLIVIAKSTSLLFP